MSKKVILLLLIVLASSCKTKNEATKINKLKAYKDLGQVQRSVDITISTFWSFKPIDLDSIFIEKAESIKSINKYLNNLHYKKKQEIFMNPKYAFMVTYQGKKDTLYMDENLRNGYYNNAHIEIEDKKGFLKDELKKLNPAFFSSAMD